MTRRFPFISVIVPTHWRPRQLAACLEALASLDYPRDCFEVVVADDGGTVMPDALAPFSGRINITLVAQTHAGPATARNTGAAKAQGGFLAFTDDDCAPAPDWLRGFAARFADSPDQLIGGRTLNALPRDLYATASQSLVDYLYVYYNNVPGQAVFFTSNNMALPAARFREVGGFDTSFPLAAGEDRELCDRWLSFGYQMTYASEIVVNHAHALTLRKFWRQHFNYGRSALHFHRARARRNHAPVRVEPLSFYVNLLRHPRARSESWRAALPLSMLFAVSQAANTTGFLYERLRSPKRTNFPPEQSKPTFNE